ncbi:MAG: alcohol dehydrogenase catalytic domain-containing protein [Candidatus Firestonebacteria bacterium]
MKALVKDKKEIGLNYIDVPLPEVGDKDVLFKIKVSAICGTDLNLYQWNDWAKKVYTRLPLIPGHECCGEVVEVGQQVKRVSKGDRIVVETHVPCGRCYHCLNGMQHICPTMGLVGATMNGCFAEYCCLPEVSVWKISDSLSTEAASLLEPMGVPLRAVLEGNVGGETVVIIGCGSLGQFAIALSKIMGASKVIGIDVNAYRLEIAKSIGADLIFNPEKENIEKQILDLTSGLGAGVIIEVSGNTDAIQQSFNYLRKGGRVFLIGQPKKEAIIDIGKSIVLKEAKIRGFHGREMFKTWEIAEKILLSGKIDWQTIVTHKFPLEEYQKAFELLMAGKACKVLFQIE